MKYTVIYANTEEVLGTDLDYEEAQECVRRYAKDMHEEQAADLVIKKECSNEY